MADNDKITADNPTTDGGNGTGGALPIRPRHGVNVRHLNDQERKYWSRAIHFATSNGMLPALRSAFAHLMPFIDENCPTAYTDCRYRIGLSPELFDIDDENGEGKSSIEKLTTVMIHETMHNTQHHRQRLLEKKGIDSMVSNFATDLEINGILAAGLAQISFRDNPANEDPTNGNWDWFFGEHRKLTAEEAERMNERKTESGDYVHGKKYSEGDWCYTGCLIPGHGEFHDFPLDQTAEQYLGMLEYDTEDMSLQQFMDNYNKRQNDSNGNGNGSGNDSGNSGDNGNGQDGGQGRNQDSGSDSGADAQDGSGSDGGSQNGAGGTGSNGSNGSNNGSSSGGDGSESGSSGDCSDGSGRELAGSDGYGGFGSYSGKNRVQVKKIYRRNPDGSRTRVGERAFVDNIDVAEDSDLWKEVSEKLGLDPINRSEEQKVRDQIAHDIEEQRRSNQYGGSAGNMILNYIAKGLRPPVVNWKRILRTSATRATEQQRKGRDDYSFKRISRRRNESEFIFPGMVSYVPTIRFAIDTSGSMSQQEYFNVLSEAEGILRETKAKIEVTCVDTVASAVRKVRSVKEITKELIGGGGTDMSVAVKQVCEEPVKGRPDVLVIATDGCYDWNSFAESLRDPRLKNTAVIVMVVYKFTDDCYFAKQGELSSYQNLVRKYNRKAQVVQAFAK